MFHDFVVQEKKRRSKIRVLVDQRWYDSAWVFLRSSRGLVRWSCQSMSTSEWLILNIKTSRVIVCLVSRHCHSKSFSILETLVHRKLLADYSFKEHYTLTKNICVLYQNYQHRFWKKNKKTYLHLCSKLSKELKKLN